MTAHETPANLLHKNEVARLNALYQYEIVDTPPENGFDTLALLAATIFDSEQAHICFVDEHRIFYKTSTGNTQYITNREDSPCAISVADKKVIVLNNEHKFSKEIDFYVAAPIINKEGFALGTIAVTDNKPHPEVSDQQLKMLEMLAILVMENLETRLTEKKTATIYQERLRSLAHDIKNPVTSISLYAQLLSSKEMNSAKVFSMAERIENSSKRIEEKLNSLFI